MSIRANRSAHVDPAHGGSKAMCGPFASSDREMLTSDEVNQIREDRWGVGFGRVQRPATPPPQVKPHGARVAKMASYDSDDDIAGEDDVVDHYTKWEGKRPMFR